MDQVQADYDRLEELVQKFANQGQEIEQMIRQVQNSMGKLQNGGWIGRGSDSFFNEMEGEVMPATQRLQQALEEASQTTRNISQSIQQAEDEAGGLFR